MTGVCKTTLAAAALVLATVVPASADKASEIDAALRTVFKSKDVDRNGVLDSAEITNFVNNLFAAMDTDGDRLVTQREFHGLSLNLLPLARKYGRTKQYAAARERIRRRWTLGRRKTLSLVNVQTKAKGELFAVAGARQRLTFSQFKKARFVRELVSALQ
jgi:hypothetical protein